MGNSFSDLELCVGATPQVNKTESGEAPLTSSRRSKRQFIPVNSETSSQMSLPQYNDKRNSYTPANNAKSKSYLQAHKRNSSEYV